MKTNKGNRSRVTNSKKTNMRNPTSTKKEDKHQEQKGNDQKLQRQPTWLGDFQVKNHAPKRKHTHMDRKIVIVNYSPST